MPTKRTVVTRQDFGVWPSERLTDNDDGGGLPTGERLQGDANELFKAISSIMRTNGGFSTALVYMGIQRQDDAPLIGSFAAITKPPKDPAVSYLLFPATKHGELRSEILKRIEAYSVGTIESRMTLLSTQSQNSKIVQAYQRPGEPLPMVGDRFCLRQDKSGYAQHEQYIQVSTVDSEDRIFTSQNGKDFVRTVVQLEITSKLEADFSGADYPSESYIDNPCKIRETHVADAAQYYGVKPLAEAIAKESMSLRVPSLMEKLVPTNQIETAMIDLTAAGQRQSLFDGAKAGADGVVTLTINKRHTVGTISNLYFGNAITPGTVNIDTSKGFITDNSGTLFINASPIGTVSYGSGNATISVATWTGYIRNIQFRPAAAELRVADTSRIDIDINNQGYNHVLTIDPPPAVGSLIVSYRAQGRWYDLRDDGTGALRGASEAHGSGNVNQTTGTVNISTGELPDVGSAILFAWATQATYFNRSDVNPSAKMLLQLEQECDPSSIALVWDDGEEKTATADASGIITGDWTGKYDPQTQQIRIDTGANFNHPEGALDISVSYSTGDKTKLTFDNLIKGSDGNITIELGDTPIKPNTLSLRYPLEVIDRVQPDGKNWIDPYARLTDDGNGNLINANSAIVGTIDYTARTLNFNPDINVTVPAARYNTYIMQVNDGLKWNGTGYENNMKLVVSQTLSHYEYVDAIATLADVHIIDISFYDTHPQSTVFETLSTGNIEIDLLPRHAEVIVPSSVNVTWGGRTYFDRLGSVFTDLDATTGSATLGGTIDYADGKLLLKNWDWTDGSPPDITSLVTSLDGNPVDAVTFRTPTSPIRPGSLQIRATAIDGTIINVIADYSGNLNSENTTGFIEAEYGVASVRFGAMVDAAGNEGEDWYSQDAIVGGKIWRPLLVLAETITFNAVAYTYLPIDSKVVKIDTVRLPQDGRIPIFRRGDNILITNSQTDDIGSAHTGGQTVQLSRGDVDRICVSDADGKPVNAELWDYSLEDGSITWTTPLDISGYTMPLSVMHAQEERNRIVKADIDGTLSLQFANKRNYPIENTYVSSILIGGDLEVRVSIPFTQRNWDGEWRDEPNGEQLLNKLNLKDHPMILTDKGAIKERWMMKMLSDNQLELWGETLGYVGKFDALNPIAPINPATGVPYFTLPHQALGGGDAPWAPQNIIRFNTWGTLLAVWVLRAVQPTPDAPEGDDGFTMCLFGDTTEII